MDFGCKSPVPVRTVTCYYY